MPKVSVIIPTFNRAAAVREAIDSVLGQTHRDIEVILVDDGSSDNTREVLEGYISARQILYFHQKNSGPSAARNTGIRMSSGTYLKFLDSDDLLFPEQIERQLADIKDEGEDVISITDCVVQKPNGKTETREAYIPRKEDQYAAFIESNRGMIHAFLVPKHLIVAVGGFDETLNNCEDLDLWLRILHTGAHIKHLGFNGCFCRVTATSHSSDIEDMFLQKCKVYNKVNRSLAGTQFSTKYMADSVMTINTQLLEECMVRRMNPEGLLKDTLKMTEYLYGIYKKGVFGFLFKTLGLKNYLKLHYVSKQLIRNDYKSFLIYHDYQWKNE